MDGEGRRGTQGKSCLDAGIIFSIYCINFIANFRFANSTDYVSFYIDEKLLYVFLMHL